MIGPRIDDQSDIICGKARHERITDDLLNFRMLTTPLRTTVDKPKYVLTGHCVTCGKRLTYTLKEGEEA